MWFAGRQRIGGVDLGRSQQVSGLGQQAGQPEIAEPASSRAQRSAA
jgi:hypothetical protein